MRKYLVTEVTDSKGNQSILMGDSKVSTTDYTHSFESIVGGITTHVDQHTETLPE